MKRVLLVEDQPDILNLLRTLLLEAGYEVLSCLDFAGARQMLCGGERFDLLVADILLPGGGSGTELAALAKAKGVRSLLITGHPEQIQVLERESEPHLQKPFRAAEFMQQIERIWQKG